MTMVLFMDSFAILVGIISNIPRILKYHTSHHLYFLWPFINIFSQGSTFMIVSMAFERYFASRNPLPTHQVSFQNIKPKTYRFSSYFSQVPILRTGLIIVTTHIFQIVMYQGDSRKEQQTDALYSITKQLALKKQFLTPPPPQILSKLFSKKFHF